MIIPLASPPLLRRRVTVLGFGVVIVVILRAVVGVVPPQHLSAEIDEDLVHVHCEMCQGRVGGNTALS